MNTIYRKIYYKTKEIYKNENENYKKSLAYRLLNCVKCEDIESFLNFVLRSLCSRDNTQELIDLLNEGLFEKRYDKKDVMYCFIMGLIG